MIRNLLYLALFLSMVTCRHSPVTYVQVDDGVTISWPQQHHQGAKVIKLQVISDKVIRVCASPTDSFPKTQSLVVTGTDRPLVSWNLKQHNDVLTLSTGALNASIGLTHGDITFTDSLGRVLLKEGLTFGHRSKSFVPATVEGQQTFSVRQTFEPSPDEAFYGLGQHQEGMMNYKGKDVSLYQYNTKVAVPFLVSNKNYGILWDNYSLTKFGDPRPYQSISHLNLFDKNGESGGLSARYVSKEDPSQIFVSRLDTAVDYENLSSLKNIPSGFPLGKGLVYWDGFMGPVASGPHKFQIVYAGYIKIWIDGKQVANHWRQSWNPGTIQFQLQLEKGKKYPVKIEWDPDGDESYLAMKCLKANVTEQNKLSLYSEVGDVIDYYFIQGKNLDDVIGGYRGITGRAPIFPSWAMGLWQSRERYQSQEELLSVASEFRKRKIPFDNIVLDWFYWKQDEWGSQQFDAQRFPDPSAMIKQLHEKHNAHFMISVWPKFYEGIDNYKKFDAKGWLYRENVRNRQKDWVGSGYVSTFYDAFNPQAREAFWELLEHNLYAKGVDAWWLDASEPDILSNASIEQRKLLMNPTALGSASKYFNAYPLVNEMGIYDGQRKANPDQRVFILTRSAFAGSQRYAAATWSGDIAARWQDFKAQIPAGLNFSLSGIPYWTTDIGGFSVEKRFVNATGDDLEEWREQMTRWFQFGAFCPLFRVHGQYPYREIFNVAPETHPAYQTMLYYDRLRYRLMPYLYSLAGKTYFDDYTIMRALVMDFGDDKK
ncbi:MAG: TIM-barrel domain-containing protein, partial [Bacteroidota bacterium]